MTVQEARHLSTNPRLASHTRERFRRSIWPRLLVLFAAIAFGLGLSELALRMFGIGYGSAPLVGHPILHHWHPSNYRFRPWGPAGEFGGHEAYYNSAGMSMQQAPPPPEANSIVFLGDSFTEGIQVPEERRFANLVSRDLGLSLINLGCSSYSPLLDRLALETCLEGQSPRVVVLQLFCNDLEDEQRYRQIAQKNSTGRIVSVPGDETPWSVRLSRQSYLVRFIRMLVLSWQHSDAGSSAKGATVSNNQPSDSQLESIARFYTEENRSAFEDSLRAIGAYCKQSGCRLIVWSVPDPNALVAKAPDRFNEYCRAACKQVGIEFLDMAAVFAEDSHRVLFFPSDGHFTASGHEAAARAILEHLRRAPQD